ncbi:MAG TPA: phosphate ABC transporter permease PstA [Actinomycetota bacterium]|nr:phosphate ABC transporter permease PstA [Actinomycetota bacterium]
MAMATDVTRSVVGDSLRGEKRDLGGAIFAGLLFAALLAALAILLLLFWDVGRRGVPLLAERGLSFFTNGPSGSASKAGIGPALVGSLLMMAIVAVVAFPLGVGSAVYLEEYAHDTKLTRIITTNIRNLAGVPSIVYGILGLVVFVEALNRATDIRDTGALISGGLTLAVLVLPIVIITTSEALRAVPRTIREAAYGVGATRWEVIRSHVLPYALPGIMTGVVISLARAFGETAPLLLVGAVRGFFATTGGTLEQILHQPYTALPVQIFTWTSQPQEEFQDLAAAAILVMMLVLVLMNGVAIWLRNRYERRW